MSAETVLVRLAGVGRRPDKVSQNCFEAAEHGRSDENFVTIFRVYYDGERVIENTNREVIPIEETSQIEPKQKKCVIH